MEQATMSELADTIEGLAKEHREPWYIVKKPHSYPDGTTHFTHVHYDARDSSGAATTVRVASYVTPELGELLCVLHIDVAAIVAALRQTTSTQKPASMPTRMTYLGM
jgi:hypothetical protein